MEEGEQNTSYFFRLEKNHATLNTIHQLKMNDKISKDPKEISEYCSTFYCNLDAKASNDFLNSKINHLEKAVCDQPIRRNNQFNS